MRNENWTEKTVSPTCEVAGDETGSRRAGMSLVEVVIATGILGLGLLGLFTLSANTRRGYEMNQDVETATNLAESKLESLLAQPAAMMIATNDTVGQYRRTWSVISNTSPESLTLQVRVTWRNVDNKARVVNLQTIRLP